MRVEITKGGGIVPVVITTIADAASLAPADADRLRSMVEEAGLFDLQSSGGGDMPDAASYEIVVTDDGRRKQVVVSDGTMPPAVQSLISWVSRVPGHEERIG